MRYSEQRAAQVAAFLMFKEGGRIEVLKLMKLMYLAERESLRRFGEPITGDRLVSMEHGPAMSTTLDHVNNFIDSEQDGWSSWVSDRENHLLALARDGDPTPHLTSLSDADLDVLESTYREFGSMTASQLRNYTHDNCAEWEDPNQSSALIPYSRLLKAVGYNPQVATEISNRIESQRSLDDSFDSLSR